MGMPLDMELPTPNPERLLSEPAPTLPQIQGGVRGGTGLGPAPSQPTASPPPTAPTAPMGETNPQGEVLATSPPPEGDVSGFGTDQLVGPDDSRYSDPSWTVMLDTIIGGLTPWLAATIDVAQGRVPSENFDAARMQHQQKIDEIKAQNPQFVEAAEKAAPFVTGLLTGIAKPAQTAMGTAGRGAAAGGAMGAVQGYTGADPELSSTDTDRVVSAAGGAARGATMGAAG